MVYEWQRWMADEFRAAGLTVIEVEGWKDRGRPASTGGYKPDRGITVHHTGSTTRASNPNPTLRLLIEGRSDLPGPLAPWSVDYLGRVWVIAAGRCNHAGRVGKVTDLAPLGADGNALFMGDEVDTDGTQPLSTPQREAIALTNAVYLEHFNCPTNRVHRHQDISGTGKWDIGSISTTALRADAERARKNLGDDMFSDEDSARLRRLEEALETLTKKEARRFDMERQRDKRRWTRLVGTLADVSEKLTELIDSTQDDATKVELKRLQTSLISELKASPDTEEAQQ